MAKAVIVACSDFGRIRVHVVTRRSCLAVRLSDPGPVRFAVSAILPVVFSYMNLSRGSDDRRYKERNCR
jgi:hypothetical protein